jgi:chromosome partitioning protein
VSDPLVAPEAEPLPAPEADTPGTDTSGTDTSDTPESDALFEPAPAVDPVPTPAAAATPELGPTGRPWPDLTPPPAPATHGPALVIALCNQKGGVGKTTTTISLGAALAELGRKVLLVDFDPQGSLAVGLGINPHELESSVYNVLMDRRSDIREIVVKTAVENLDLVPANIDLSAAEVALVGEVAREMTLKRALAPILPDYDFVLIDCQPSLGLLTVNALSASDGVVIPLECEFFALRGVAMLTETIGKVQDRLNPDLKIIGILATMFDSRTLHAREVLDRVVDAFGDRVFYSVIARTVRFPDASVAGEPITTFSSSSPGAQSYRTLAVEVLQRSSSA